MKVFTVKPSENGLLKVPIHPVLRNHDDLLFFTLFSLKSGLTYDLLGFVSGFDPCYIGKTHDYALLKSEFPPQNDWFSDYKIRVDLGYQGFQTDYQCQKVIIPYKKPRNQELTQIQKDENKQKSRKRIWVEHSIDGMKKYRFLSDRFR